LTLDGRVRRAVRLRKRDSELGVQSLIVPASEYQPAKRLKLVTSKAINPIRFGRLLEQQPDWVWAAVEPLDSAAATRSPVTVAPGFGRA
jgi:hypothetical protein